MRAVTALSLALMIASNAVADFGYYSVYVDARAPAGGDGRSWSTAYNNLHDAIDALKDPKLYPLPVWEIRVKIAGATYRSDRGTGDRNASVDFSHARWHPAAEAD